MKKMFLFLTLGICISLLSSCSNEDEFKINQKQETTQVLRFTYQGKDYTSEYIIGKDSSYYLADKDVSSLLENLTKNSSTSTLVKEDGSITYFDNLKSLKEYLETETHNKNSTRALPVESFLSIWNDPWGKGYWMGFEATFSYGPTIEVGNQGRCPSVPKKMNNKISSFELFGGSVTFFQYYDFGGESITFSGGAGRYAYVAHLKDIQRPYFYKGRIYYGHWDDMISSFIVDK